MAATTKTFKTTFEIAGKYTGKPAFAAVNRDIDRTQRNAVAASQRIKGMFNTIKIGLAGFAAYAGYKAFRGLFDIGGQALDAAKEVRKATDVVRQNYARLIPKGKLKPEELEKLTQETMAFAESLHGIDAEDFAQSMSKLNEVLSTVQIKQLAKGYQDYLITINKGIPTLEQMANAEQKIIAFVVSGKPAILRDLRWSKERIAAYNEQLESMRESDRQAARSRTITKALGKETGALAKFLESDAGKLYQKEQAQEALNETMGKSSAAILPKLNEEWTKLYTAMQPVAVLIDQNMSEAFQNLTKWLDENRENVVKWGENIVNWSKWAWDSFWWLSDQSKDFFKPIADNTLRELENIKKGFWAAWEGIKEIWNLVVPYFQDLIDKLKAIFASLYDWIIDPFKRGYDYIIKLFPWLGKGGGGGVIAPAPYSGGARQEGDYVPPWQQPTPSGGGGKGMEYASGIGPVPAGSGGVTNATLADERARLAEEYRTNPAVRDKLLRVAQAEVGTSDPAKLQAFMETVFNRAASRKQTLDRALQADYYETLRHGPLGAPTPAQVAKHEAAIAKVASGGSITGKPITGNWSGRPGGGRGGPSGYDVAKIGGEQFSVQSADAAWAVRIKAKEEAAMQQATKMVKEPYDPQHPQGKPPQGWGVSFSGQNAPAPPPPPKPLKFPTTSSADRMMPAGSKLKDMIKDMNIRQRTQGATGGQSVAMNPTINVNGVAAGSENLMAEKVKRVVQNNSRELIAQLKQARSYETRLGYV